jgi:hypothetical protein
MNGINCYHEHSIQGLNKQQQQTPSEGVWLCSRAHALEAALMQALQQQQQQCAPAVLAVLADLPQLLLCDVQPAGYRADYVR